MEMRGIADHHITDSIYSPDPNGYVIELTAKCDAHDAVMDPGRGERFWRWAVNSVPVLISVVIILVVVSYAAFGWGAWLVVRSVSAC